MDEDMASFSYTAGMKHETLPTHLDVKAFAHAARTLTGQAPLSEFQRLIQETQGLGAENALNWLARGELQIDEAGAEQVWLHLTIDTCLPLTCQRCLGPVDIVVAIQQSFRFCDSEEVAAAQDAEAEEDVLVLSPAFDLRELIEDEVLMALPLVPRHETCPVDVKLAVVDPAFDTALVEKSQPFAVLAQLKTGRSD
jgi:uncharacterized protein